MKLITGNEIGKNLGGIIYDETQKDDNSYYLTVKKVYGMEGRGELDFGGSEFERSKFNEIISEKKSEENDYGWWFLEEGVYQIEYNESIEELKGESFAIIQPAERLLQCGAYHPTILVDKKDRMVITLNVGKSGLNIKENSRISRLFLLAP